MSKTCNTKPRFKVGGWVTFRFGTRIAVVREIEDRGRIGVQWRRLFRIELTWRDGEPDRFEMPEEEMTTAPRPTNAATIT